MLSLSKIILTTFCAAVVLAAPPTAIGGDRAVESHISHSGGLVTLTGNLIPDAASTTTGEIVSSTHGSAAATCTDGVPASEQHRSRYPILNYTNIVPKDNWTSYQVKPDWYKAHYISGPHYMAFTHKQEHYGEFKCQYTCNGAHNCNSYFVWYENINTQDEHMNCLLFDAVISESDFTPSDGTIASGAYDRLCQNPAN